MDTCSPGDLNVSPEEVEAVAKGWMVDFYFLTLCRYFKEDKRPEFRQTLQSLEALLEGWGKMKPAEEQKIHLCGFLARVLHGKQQDVHYEGNKRVTPLMSALSLWQCMEELVVQEGLCENIKKLLFIQCVAVNIEKGDYTKASWTLDWLTENCEMPQNLKMKLSVIVNQKDSYHKFLLNFSFEKLLENIKTFVEEFLKEHPSDFLAKAAAKVVVSCREQRSSDESMDCTESESLLSNGKQQEVGDGEEREASVNNFNENAESESNATNDSQKVEASSVTIQRYKKTLYAAPGLIPWKPDSAKKPLGRLRRTLYKKECGESLLTSGCTTPVKDHADSRRKHKWTVMEDKNLVKGVERHGEGKWAKIMQDFEFPKRTSVMLKDRWRTMKRLGLVT